MHNMHVLVKMVIEVARALLNRLQNNIYFFLVFFFFNEKRAGILVLNMTAALYQNLGIS